jgi:5-methylcytosine-specific restriction endonuclease McrA
MSAYTLSHLSDDVLIRRLAELAAQHRATTAQLLAHLAEVETRHLHLRAGYDSMKAYCVGELHFSEDAARKRVHAAHVAREFPVLFEAVADGRLHLTAIRILAAHLSPANVDELVEEATHKTNSEIELLLARRFPQAEVLRLDDGVSPQVVAPQSAIAIGCAPGRTQLPAPAPAKIAPITVERYTLQVTIDAETHEKLRRLQDLLGHSVPAGDVAQVLDRALEMALTQLEKRKFAKVAKPRRPGIARKARTIPAHVKLAVYKRDAARCAFVGETGHRCGSTSQLEYDHIEPVARGGSSTASNIRLVCRAHNQFAAEQAFGKEFMEEKRRQSELREDVAAGLRSLGMRAKDARQAPSNSTWRESQRLRKVFGPR